MSDTTIAAIIGALVDSAGAGLITWLARWRDSHAELLRARSDAYLRFIEACSIAEALLGEAADLAREHRWWHDWPWWVADACMARETALSANPAGWPPDNWTLFRRPRDRDT